MIDSNTQSIQFNIEYVNRQYEFFCKVCRRYFTISKATAREKNIEDIRCPLES